MVAAGRVDRAAAARRGSRGDRRESLLRLSRRRALANLDAQYAVATGSDAAWWIGAGPSYARATFSGASAHVWGWNANTGYEWKAGSLTP